MTGEEIQKSFQEAKDKRKQIDILAQLNDCSTIQVIELLKSRGVDVDESLGIKRITMPEVVEEALTKAAGELLNQLEAIEKEKENLKKREETVTKKYKEIMDYLNEAKDVY